MKEICPGCEVRAQRLAYAREADEEFGIWGGLNRTERVRLREGMRARRPAERRPGRRVTGWSRSGGLLSGAGMAAWLAGVPF